MPDHIITGGETPRPVKENRKLPSLSADMALCFTMCFTAYAYWCDGAAYVANIVDSQLVNNISALAVCAVLVVVWVLLSIQNGLKGRRGFLAFTVIFWLVPLTAGLFISAGDLSSATGLSAQALNIAMLFIKIIVQSPMAGINMINEYLPLTNAFAVCILTSVFAGSFLLAYLIATIKNNKSASVERSCQNEN